MEKILTVVSEAPVSVQPMAIPEVLEIRALRFSDSRGYFTEAYHQALWAGVGFTVPFVQDNLSKSALGALRGMHYQLATHPMGKLVRVISGRIFDVAVDLRRGSPTFAGYVAKELSEEDGSMLWIPPGFAHGFLALEPDTRVYYKCAGFYAPQAERSLFYRDPKIGIPWPITPLLVSEKDKAAPMLDEAEYDFVYEGASAEGPTA